MTTVFLKNIGTIVSGDIADPILEGDGIVIEDGKIMEAGFLSGMTPEKGVRVIDCGGMTVTPGLIDSHCHVVLGDWAPRQQQVGFLDSAVHGGVTTFISAGEVHLPGRPKDPAGTKALAILASKSFSNFRPGGAKVIGGGLILEKGLTREDFAEMAREGVSCGGRNRPGECEGTGRCGPHGSVGKRGRDDRHDAYGRDIHPRKQYGNG